MHVYAQVYEFTQAVLKLFIFFLHSPFRNKDEAEKHSCKNNKAVRSLARQIKSYFQMWNDRQTDSRNLRWPSGTGLRHRGTLLCSETDEYSLLSGGSRPSSFRETLSVPQINTSFGFFAKILFCLWPRAWKGCEGSLKLAALIWHILRNAAHVCIFLLLLRFDSQKQSCREYKQSLE